MLFTTISYLKRFRRELKYLICIITKQNNTTWLIRGGNKLAQGAVNFCLLVYLYVCLYLTGFQGNIQCLLTVSCNLSRHNVGLKVDLSRCKMKQHVATCKLRQYAYLPQHKLKLLQGCDTLNNPSQLSTGA